MSSYINFFLICVCVFLQIINKSYLKKTINSFDIAVRAVVASGRYSVDVAAELAAKSSRFRYLKMHLRSFIRKLNALVVR